MRFKSTLAAVVAAAAVTVMIMMESGAAQSTMEECKSTITAMTGCLPYATGKAATPTADCCKVVNTMVQHNKDCLCKFIALVHQGSPEISSLGVQEAKLIQLPSACNLKNVSANNCPKLAPSQSPSALNSTSTTSPSGGAGYRGQVTLPIEALFLVAIMAFVFPFPDGLRFTN